MWSAWLPVASYAALIFTLSSMPTLAPPSGMTNADKAAHFVEYAVLGGVLARAWGRSFPARGPAVWLAAAVGAGVLIGALDEIFQGSVGREASVADWITDAAGVCTAAAAVVWDRSRARSPYRLWKRERGERSRKA